MSYGYALLAAVSTFIVMQFHARLRDVYSYHELIRSLLLKDSVCGTAE